MSIYVDKVHIYCDHENCDNEILIADELLGSCELNESDDFMGAVSDTAFDHGWIRNWHNSKFSCPSCDDGN